MSNVSILILAAGKGVRMKSSLPKVLHPVGGVPMVERVCRSVMQLKPKSLCVIVGHQGQAVRDYMKERHPRIAFYTQRVLNGSGGAVRCALPWIRRRRGEIVVACGDAPLIRPDTLKKLLRVHRMEKNTVTVLTTIVENPTGYGRIIRNSDKSVGCIVEELDASPDQRLVKEINTGTYIFDAKALARALPKLSSDNAKGEFYLTDTLSILGNESARVGAFACEDPRETIGINKRVDLAQANLVFNRWKIEALMDDGVSFVDPGSCYIDEAVKIGPDTVVWPNSFILGQTQIGSRCQIGPWTHISDCKVENDVIIRATFADRSIIRHGSRVGPFSRIRPDSELGPDAHLGNFSEVKKTVLGAGSKVNHLSYLGDAKLGKNVNIGAGTITCNYDGIKKSPTIIEDNAFIGSNVNLIAPIRVGGACHCWGGFKPK